MGRIGFLEIAVIVGIALLLFGAGRIADVGKGLGEGIKNFKKGLKDDDAPPPQLPKKSDDDADHVEPNKPA